MATTMASNLAAGVARRYGWLRWDAARQAGLNARVLGGKAAPETSAEFAKVYAAQRGMLLRIMTPYLPAFERLTRRLHNGRGGLSAGDRARIEKIYRAVTRREITPEHINTARQIAHKAETECGFPSFREAAEALDAARGRNYDGGNINRNAE